MKEVVRINDCGLIFFDPDKGLQSSGSNNKNARSQEHLHWDELNEFSHISRLVFQYRPRHTKWEVLIESALKNIIKMTSNDTIWYIPTKEVVYFLLPTKGDETNISQLLENIYFPNWVANGKCKVLPGKCIRGEDHCIVFRS